MEHRKVSGGFYKSMVDLKARSSEIGVGQRKDLVGFQVSIYDTLQPGLVLYTGIFSKDFTCLNFKNTWQCPKKFLVNCNGVGEVWMSRTSMGRRGRNAHLPSFLNKSA